MRVPSAAEVLRVWELGQGKKAWYRALLLLAPLFPESTFGTLAEMTIGSRNTYLLALRERMFGPTISAVVTCEACAERTESAISTNDILAGVPQSARFAGDERLTCVVGGAEVAYRLLSSRDLAAASTRRGVVDAQQALIAGALLETAADADTLPAVVEAVADGIVTADPLADIRLGVTCASCRHAFVTSFDVVGFLWAEIDAEVARLLDDVHRLAAAYGWSESTILTMSRSRRREYLRRAS